MDVEGYFHFYDRCKDLIKCKGYSVFAKDVEEVLYAHPQVKAAGVIGVPDPALGQRIKAIVVLQAGARGKVGEEEIKAYCKERLAEYKVPQVIEFRGELPAHRRGQGLAPRAARRRHGGLNGGAVLPGGAPHPPLRRTARGQRRQLRAARATRSSG